MIIFFGDQTKKYAYNLILHYTKDELVAELYEKKILGFQLFKDNLPHLKEFIDFYNNNIYLNFLNDREKRTLSKIILQFKDLRKIITNKEIYEQGKLEEDLRIIDAHTLNSENPQESYILMKKLHDGRRVVMDSGTFKKSQIPSLTYQHRIKAQFLDVVAGKIFDLVTEINEWIRITGDYFIFNTRPLDEKKADSICSFSSEHTSFASSPQIHSPQCLLSQQASSRYEGYCSSLAYVHYLLISVCEIFVNG